MIRFQKMNDTNLRTLKDFATPIWRECYNGVVDAAHTEMLISKYFEYDNILKFQKDGMNYEYIYFENEKAGFIAYELKTDYLYLDKFYLLYEYRGRHISKKVFAYLSDNFKLPLRLNVNRANQKAIAVYSANGFNVIKSENIPQKDGSFNEDYVMEKPLF